MDGIHDLGGRQGFGRVRYTLDAPAFHAPWEKRVNALYALAVRLGIFNMDEYRHAIERMEPRHYLPRATTSARSRAWRRCCVEKGIVTRDELERRAGGAFPLALPSAPGPHERRRARALRARRPRCACTLDSRARPRPHAGATSAARPASSSSESPAYPFPDAHAHGVAAADEPTYDVRFSSADLGRTRPTRRTFTSRCSRACLERCA